MAKEWTALTTYVSEMAEGDLPDVPTQGIDLAALTEGDESPMFVTIEAVANETVRLAVRALVVAEMRASQEPVPDVAAFVGELVERDDVKAIIESAAPAPRMPTAPVKRDNRQKQEFRYSS